MNHPEIIMVVARADNGVIGNAGAIPWHLPADLRRFKQLTSGAPMIMGRKTFDSLPGLLPGRRHIVLTRDKAWREDGAEVVHTVDQALRVANAPHVSIIGGAQIYAQFADRADRIELTEVHLSPPGDTLLTLSLDGWEESARTIYAANGEHPAHDFVTYRRRAA